MVASTVTPTSTSTLLFPPASVEEAASHAQAPLLGQRIPHLVGETPSLATTHIMIRLIRHHRWEKILLKKTSSRLVGLVLQRAVRSMWVLEIKQHQRYNRIKWNFGMDNDIDDARGGGDDSGGGNAVGGGGCCCYNGNHAVLTNAPW
mmetsp:Transcript_3117/g.5501  ORF Transcript_3117/g.5501 Transcript_3117/m.5501 type:complete len:147 (+) Transcript_3117:649-1089(+)